MSATKSVFPDPATVTELRGKASSRITETAASLRHAGQEFGQESYPAQAADFVADNLTHAADIVRDKELSSAVDDVKAFAQRNPALVLGGAALLGFAAARMMSARSRK